MKIFKKIAIVLVLLAVITLCGFFIYARIAAVGNQNNYFNSRLRPVFIRKPFMRTILSLHDDGDARFDYIGKNVSNIQLHVFAMQGMQADAPMLQELSNKIQQVTGIPAGYTIGSSDITFQPTITQTQRDNIIDQYEASASYEPGDLYVFIFNQDASEQSLLGETYRDHAIEVFNGALITFTRNAPTTFVPYQISTLLHEFGHQIGLGHNNNPGCLMNPKAEIDGEAQYEPSKIVTDFCPYEKAQIQAELGQ